MKKIFSVTALGVYTGLTLAVCLAWGSTAWAAPVIQRRIQAQKAAQQQMMQQYQQQVMAQQQAQQMAAYQQAVAQQQAAVQQQAAYQKAAAEYAAYKQAMQQAVAQRNAELQAASEVRGMIAQKQANEAAAVQQARQMLAQKQAVQVAAVQQAVNYKRASEMAQYKQAVANRQAVEVATQAQLNQEIGQYADFLTKRKAALAAQGIQASQVQTAQQMAQYNQLQQVRAAQTGMAVAAQMQAQDVQRAMGAKMAQDVYASRAAQDKKGAVQESESETTVAIDSLWQALDSSAVSWGQILDDEIKILTVAEYIDRFKKVGITIKKAPGHYVHVIDSIAAEDAGYLSAPFMNVLSYAAIVEYDFENGQNKDEMARRVLGEGNFKANKARQQQ
ncbi:MAG: hypothetical protein HGA80_03130 [Candidatus Omnitrophica bacterium]|nr:hypothetical protein [Candidatus Omnitrophota bacterium]